MADEENYIQDDEAELVEALEEDPNGMTVDDEDDDVPNDEGDWETEAGSVAPGNLGAERRGDMDSDDLVFEDDSVQGFFSHRGTLTGRTRPLWQLFSGRFASGLKSLHPPTRTADAQPTEVPVRWAEFN
jgi:hypothetical protein